MAKFLLVDSNPETHNNFRGYFERLQADEKTLPIIKSWELIAKTDTSEAKALLDACEPHHDFAVIAIEWNGSEPPGYTILKELSKSDKFQTCFLIAICDNLTASETMLLKEMGIGFQLGRQSGPMPFNKAMKMAAEERQRIEPIEGKIKELLTIFDTNNIEELGQYLNQDDIREEVRNNPRFVHILGDFHIRKKEYEKAIAELTESLKSTESKPMVQTFRCLSTLAKAYCLSGNFDEALGIFDKLEGASPRNVEHKIAGGDTLLAMGDIDAAEEKYQAALEIDPNSDEAKNGLGKVAMEQRDYEKARSLFAEVPDNYKSATLASYFNNRAVTLARTGRIDEANAFYDNALKVVPDHKAIILFNRGLAFLKQQAIASAAESFKECLSEAIPEFIESKKILSRLKECDDLDAELQRILQESA